MINAAINPISIEFNSNPVVLNSLLKRSFKIFPKISGILMTIKEIETLAIKYLEEDNRHSSNMRHYVLRFFLVEKKEFNPLNWNSFHDDFIRWLDSVNQLKDKDKTLSLGTKRNCLAALNSFYKWLNSKKVMPEAKRI